MGPMVYHREESEVSTVSEFIFNACLLVLLCLLWGTSTQIEIWNGYAGARYWPMVLIGIGVVLLSMKTAMAWRAIPAERRTVHFKRSIWRDSGQKRLALAFLSCFVHGALLPKGGFLLSTFLLGAALSKLLGASRPRQMLLAGCAAAIPIFVVFVWGLKLRLPRGVGALYTASIWLENLLG